MSQIEKISAIKAHKAEPIHTAPPRTVKKARTQAPKDSFSSGEKAGFFGKVKRFWAENVTGKGLKRPDADAIQDFATRAAVAGGAIGAAAGGFIGYQAGKMEAANAQRSHVTWQEPVMERKHLGNIPSDYYTPWWGGWLGEDHVRFDDKWNIQGVDPIYRDAPVYNPDGSIKMATKEADISSQRFGPVSGAIGGAIIGGIGGVAGGIAVGLLNRIAKGK